MQINRLWRPRACMNRVYALDGTDRMICQVRRRRALDRRQWAGEAWIARHRGWPAAAAAQDHPQPGDTKLIAAGSKLAGLLAPGADGGDADQSIAAHAEVAQPGGEASVPGLPQPVHARMSTGSVPRRSGGTLLTEEKMSVLKPADRRVPLGRAALILAIAAMVTAGCAATPQAPGTVPAAAAVRPAAGAATPPVFAGTLVPTRGGRAWPAGVFSSATGQLLRQLTGPPAGASDMVLSVRGGWVYFAALLRAGVLSGVWRVPLAGPARLVRAGAITYVLSPDRRMAASLVTVDHGRTTEIDALHCRARAASGGSRRGWQRECAGLCRPEIRRWVFFGQGKVQVADGAFEVGQVFVDRGLQDRVSGVEVAVREVVACGRSAATGWTAGWRASHRGVP
jgi:hypothetical protein